MKKTWFALRALVAVVSAWAFWVVTHDVPATAGALEPVARMEFAVFAFVFGWWVVSPSRADERARRWERTLRRAVEER